MRRDAVLAHHCKKPITLFSVAPDVEARAHAEDTVAEAEAMLAEIKIPVVESLVGVGNPVGEIIEAGKDHDVIVVSDSGKSRLKRFLVGSVAFGVMGRSETSVLNVR